MNIKMYDCWPLGHKIFVHSAFHFHEWFPIFHSSANFHFMNDVFYNPNVGWHFVIATTGWKTYIRFSIDLFKHLKLVSPNDVNGAAALKHNGNAWARRCEVVAASFVLRYRFNLNFASRTWIKIDAKAEGELEFHTIKKIGSGMTSWQSKSMPRLNGSRMFQLPCAQISIECAQEVAASRFGMENNTEFCRSTNKMASQETILSGEKVGNSGHEKEHFIERSCFVERCQNRKAFGLNIGQSILYGLGPSTWKYGIHS